MNEQIRKRILKAGVVIIILALAVFGFWSFFRLPPGRTNLLILGTAGRGHAGGDLTDTILFFSLDHQTGKALILSLPRDIWLPALRTKLNAVYHYQGMAGAKKAVGEILNQPVDYVVLVDFDVFTQIIDTLGGVEVEVERAFDDYHYPIPGRENDRCDGDPEFRCRYEHLHFEAGKQWMDGERALKYVRSRFAEGEEGTDFARSKRQQRLLLAIRRRVLSPRVVFNPPKLLQLIKVAMANVKTDLPREKYLDLIKLAVRLRAKNFQSEVLDEEYLVNPPNSKEKYDHQWVLIPAAGDWTEIQQHVENLLR